MLNDVIRARYVLTDRTQQRQKRDSVPLTTGIRQSYECVPLNLVVAIDNKRYWDFTWMRLCEVTFIQLYLVRSPRRTVAPFSKKSAGSVRVHSPFEEHHSRIASMQRPRYGKARLRQPGATVLCWMAKKELP